MEQQDNRKEEQTHNHQAGYESAGRDIIKQGHTINSLLGMHAHAHTCTHVHTHKHTHTEDIRGDHN